VHVSRCDVAAHPYAAQACKAPTDKARSAPTDAAEGRWLELAALVALAAVEAVAAEVAAARPARCVPGVAA